ncbi:MAG TPA: ATP-dependent zinc metalloprotease FtsH [Ktedonobacteraceae bacterium]|nr:ATP-dependent zinc metalloprotease FtsH [Ktedonobacteraceae bacterium]
MKQTTKTSEAQGQVSRYQPPHSPASDTTRQQQSREPSQQGPSRKRLGFWLRLLLLIFLINLFFYGPLFFNLVSAGQTTTISLSYSSFLQQVERGNVRSVTIRSDDSVSGTFKTPLHEQQGNGQGAVTATSFTTFIPATGDPGLLPLLEKQGVEVSAEPVQSPWWQTALVWFVNLLPVFFLLYVGFMSWRGMRQMQDLQGGNLFGIGRSRAKLYSEERPTTTFADVAGVDEAKMELREVIDFLRDPQRFLKIGAHIPKGVLLVGPPGTGKTLLARAVAGEAGVPFFSASATDFVELFVGVGASRVRDLFAQARKHAPCIIFIDEIDAIGRTRSGAGTIASNDEREHTLEQLLVEMDGFEPHEAIVVLAATNRPDVLDPALLRPGRFDRQVAVDRPERRGREAILRIHTRNVPLAPDVNLEELARGTPGFSGADLANLVNEAALAAARHGKSRVDRYDFQEALDKLLLGGKREALMDERERRIVAYHEGGHALVAAVLPDVDPLYKVTIVPRGRSLGVTQFLPEDDRHNYPRSYLLQRLAVALGGRTAEEVALGEITSGAENDLKEATRLARRMVTEWGMGENTGVVAYDLEDENTFLGQPSLHEHSRLYAEATAQRVDAEVERLLEEAHQQARTVLTEHRDALDRLAQALLQEEVLEREQVLSLITAAQPVSSSIASGEGDRTSIQGGSL